MPPDRNTPMKPKGKSTTKALKLNKSAISQIFKAFNTGDTSLVDKIADPGMISFTPKPGLPAGAEGLKGQIAFFREQFPDVKFEEQETIAEGDVVYVRWRMTGTHKAAFLGRPATGRRISHSGQEVIRLKGGKMVEHRDSFDFLRFVDKLGILDEPMLKHLSDIGLRPKPER